MFIIYPDLHEFSLPQGYRVACWSGRLRPILDFTSCKGIFTKIFWVGHEMQTTPFFWQKSHTHTTKRTAKLRPCFQCLSIRYCISFVLHVYCCFGRTLYFYSLTSNDFILHGKSSKKDVQPRVAWNQKSFLCAYHLKNFSPAIYVCFLCEFLIWVIKWGKLCDTEIN